MQPQFNLTQKEMNKKQIFGVMLIALSVMFACTGNNQNQNQNQQEADNQEVKEATPNNLLIIVDPQIDFTTGSLAVAKGPESMETLAKVFDAGLGKKYSQIIVTQDFHPTNHCSFVEQGGVFPPHCVQGTEGVNVYPVLQEALNKVETPITYLTKGNLADKEEFSIFQNEENGAVLTKLINDNKYEGIDICGIASDYCVYETAKDLLNIYPANQVRIATNCIASVSDDQKLVDFMNETGVQAITF